jgi:hypothetical protein
MAVRRFMIAVMSTSTAAVSCAVDCRDSCMPLAMALRTRDSSWVTDRSPPKSIWVGDGSGRSVEAATACTAGGGVTVPAAEAAGAWAWLASPPAAMARSASSRVIRPPGPVALTSAVSRPASRSSLRTSGLVRVPPVVPPAWPVDDVVGACSALDDAAAG